MECEREADGSESIEIGKYNFIKMKVPGDHIMEAVVVVHMTNYDNSVLYPIYVENKARIC